MKLKIAPRAANDAERHARWWLRNRELASLLFEQELRGALDKIKKSPHVGVVYKGRRDRIYHRVLMPKTQFHVYYRILEKESVIRVVTIWSTARRRAPKL